MKKLTVGLGDRSYSIIIEAGCLDTVGQTLAEMNVAKKYCLIADETVASLYGKTVLNSLKNAGVHAEMISFPAGEESKNLGVFTTLLRQLAQKGIERKDGIIALGGGVTGDMAGYVAASYLRGIPFVQIPTTLLSQVDSSVGGKTGVDLPEGKNLVGAFYQPKAVFIDPHVLSTLAKDEILGGIGEIIKYGVIWDYEFFNSLRENKDTLINLDDEVVKEVIYTCCKIKAEIVAEDEKESDIRRILNYGHTIGHAVEAESGFSIIHGKAVSIGMVAAARIAEQKGLLAKEAKEDIVALLKEYGLPLEVPQEYNKSSIKEYILHDKKRDSGKVSYVLPTEIGHVIMTDTVDDETVDMALTPLA